MALIDVLWGRRHKQGMASASAISHSSQLLPTSHARSEGESQDRLTTRFPIVFLGMEPSGLPERRRW